MLPRQPRLQQCGKIAWSVASRLACLSAMIGGLATVASAQQQYKLSDDDSWKQTQTFDPTTPEGQLNEARKALAEGDSARAEILATEWIDRNNRHPLLPHAYLIRGDALVAQNDEYNALYDYEAVVRLFPGSTVFAAANQREFEIAKQYADGKSRKLWGLRIVSADDEAEEMLIRVQERLPDSRIAEEAGIRLADFYFERRKMELAVDAYSIFIENYPRSSHLAKARRRLIYAYLATFKGPEFDSRGLLEAKARLLQLQAVAPVEAQRVGADAQLIRIAESNAAKSLETARWYLRIDNPIAAEFMIRRLVNEQPHSVAAAEALRLIPEILPQLPTRVLAEAPDYKELRRQILGIDDPKESGK